MASERRDILKLLKKELRFLESGGYDRLKRTTWHPKSIFHNSLACIDFGLSTRIHSCENCHLLEFDNLENRSEVDCQFIDTSDALKRASVWNQSAAHRN